MAKDDFEPHNLAFASKLNWLRAGVLGANDGIVSVAALLVGVAAATTDSGALLIAGIASVAAGATSMALGEYVSVSSQRDSERALINLEKRELEEMPEQEFEELVSIYEAKGLSPKTARTVAEELTKHDALKAHLEAELQITEEHLTNPWHAAMSSALSFLVGSILPIVTVLLAPVEWRIPATFVSVLVMLAITGGVGAYIGGSPIPRSIARVVVGGAAALAVTYAIGSIFNVAA
jgi:VIT1/CCC1 family predicted Fe2+/Mn2+ transporter